MTTEISLQGSTQDVSSSEHILDEPVSQGEEALFQWTQQWYPIAVVEFLDPTRPHALQLLGRSLVLWCDGRERWQCFDDACPHRLVPLSEGRIEADGTLLCAYHGWRFNATGQCLRIPQSLDQETEAKHCSNPKSCAVTYPTLERQGLLWVWAESGPQAQIESQLRPPRLVPELDSGSEQVMKLSWNIRDLPYGWDFFIENVSDPAHVPVSHHGIVGNRYADAKYYDMRCVRPMSTQEGFSYEITPTHPSVVQAVHDFQPPCHIRIISTSVDGGQMILVLYATPTRPGWCRHIGCQVFVKSETGKRPKGLGFFGLPMPTWLQHVLASLFLHQDMVFLHSQEKILARRKSVKWQQAVFTPNPQDKMVIAFRQWLAQRAGGSIPWMEEQANQLSIELDKQQLFDVWKTHTQHCTTCQAALKTINRLTWLAYGASVLCVILGVLIDARLVAEQAAMATPTSTTALLRAVPPAGFWFAISGAGLLAIGGYGLKKLGRLFYVYEFEHSRND